MSRRLVYEPGTIFTRHTYLLKGTGSFKSGGRSGPDGVFTRSKLLMKTSRTRQVPQEFEGELRFD